MIEEPFNFICSADFEKATLMEQSNQSEDGAKLIKVNEL